MKNKEEEERTEQGKKMIWRAQGLKTRSPEGGMKESEMFGMQMRDSL